MLLGPVTKWSLIAAASVVLVPVLLFAILSLTSRRPTNLGPVARKLRACPDSPNCVCSCGDSASHAIAPIVWKGSPQDGLRRLRQCLARLPNARIDPAASENYLHVECTSAWFRFVDDVEFLIDTDAGVIHVRSASRVGHSDLGVNRSRVEQIRKFFDAE